MGVRCYSWARHIGTIKQTHTLWLCRIRHMVVFPPPVDEELACNAVIVAANGHGRAIVPTAAHHHQERRPIPPCAIGAVRLPLPMAVVSAARILLTSARSVARSAAIRRAAGVAAAQTGVHRIRVLPAGAATQTRATRAEVAIRTRAIPAGAATRTRATHAGVATRTRAMRDAARVRITMGSMTSAR